MDKHLLGPSDDLRKIPRDLFFSVCTPPWCLCDTIPDTFRQCFRIETRPDGSSSDSPNRVSKTSEIYSIIGAL